jgi:hypothetical protein
MFNTIYLCISVYIANNSKIHNSLRLFGMSLSYPKLAEVIAVSRSTGMGIADPNLMPSPY